MSSPPSWWSAAACRSDRRAPSQSEHLGQPAGGDVEDEAADAARVRHERAVGDPSDLLPDVVLEVAEALAGPRRPDAGVLLDRAEQVVVGEGQHAAVGVVDEHDLLRAEQALA